MNWRETVWFDPDGVDASGKSWSAYEAEEAAERRVLEDLIELIDAQGSLLVDVATGGSRIAEVDETYRRRRRQLGRRLSAIGLQDPFPWADLWQWYGHWSSALPDYASRRAHISELATSVLDELERRLRGDQQLDDWLINDDALITWQALDGRLTEMKARLDAATSLDDFQDVGRRCREVLIGASRLVFREEMVPDGAPVPSPNDSKARIGYYLDACIPGSAGDAVRGLIRAAYTLMQTVTHSSTIGSVHAFAAAQATVLIVRTLQKVEAQDRG
jgi:hypothetical protein